MNKNTRAKIKERFKGIDRLALAKELGTSRRQVDQYANGFGTVSPLRARQIERATGGHVPAHLYRPDVFGEE